MSRGSTPWRHGDLRPRLLTRTGPRHDQSWSINHLPTGLSFGEGQVEDYVDDLAERVVQLGGIAHGTARQVAKRSTLPEYPAVSAGRDHAEAVATGLAAFGKAGARGDQSVGRARGQGHRGHLHRDVARDRQVVVVRRGRRLESHVRVEDRDALRSGASDEFLRGIQR